LCWKERSLTVPRNPQLNKNGELIHLLSTEGLSRDILTNILDTAANFVSVSNREVKKGAAAARQERVQPVLREQHPHPHHLRHRRHAPVADVSTLDIARVHRQGRDRCWTPLPT
jgi:hypothetical protein